MKIAIFHNFMDNIGGAEIVALTLTRELKADLYTTNIDTEKIEKMGYNDLVSQIFSIGKIPKQAPFRQQLAFWKFRRLNLSGKYGFFIIAGDWAMSGAVNNHPNLWYAHSPLNELWEFKDFIKKELLNFWKKPIYNLWVAFNRKLSLKYSRHVDNWVANSLNTKRRIKKYYDMEATVIYPPVETKKYNFDFLQGYWLSVNRFAAHKRPEMQLEAFKILPQENLIMVASYEKGVAQFENCRKYILEHKSDNVIVKNWVSDEELKKLYSCCNGFITTAKDEDFGMTAVEAMASGKPVIAPREGGYIESVIDGQTGILIDDIDGVKIAEAMKEIKRKMGVDRFIYKEACLNQAKKFDSSVFISKIKEIVKYE